MADTGQDITISDTITLAELIALEQDTQGRCCFKVDPSGLFATVYWVNFYKKSGQREKNERGAWKLLAHQSKKVVIQ